MALTHSDYENIGRRIKQFRTDRGISQEELSELININFRHISNIETGRRYPSLEIIISIANVFEISADDLLVDSLTHTSSPVGQELHAILQDCNHDEREMLIRLLKFMKELFREFSI